MSMSLWVLIWNEWKKGNKKILSIYLQTIEDSMAIFIAQLYKYEMLENFKKWNMLIPKEKKTQKNWLRNGKICSEFLLIVFSIDFMFCVCHENDCALICINKKL